MAEFNVYGGLPPLFHILEDCQLMFAFLLPIDRETVRVVLVFDDFRVRNGNSATCLLANPQAMSLWRADAIDRYADLVEGGVG